MSIFKKGNTVPQPTWPKQNPLGYPFPEYTNSARPLKGWDAQYNAFIKSHVTPEMIKASKEALVPNFRTLDQAALISKIFEAIAFAESGFNRCTRFVETGIADKDLVTRKRNVSEGLMQVSYQDHVLYGAKFDWEADKDLKDTDPQKTIFDPYRNIHCGILIFTKRLKSHPEESFKQAGARYWSTLRPGSGYDRMSKYLRGIL